MELDVSGVMDYEKIIVRKRPLEQKGGSQKKKKTPTASLTLTAQTPQASKTSTLDLPKAKPTSTAPASAPKPEKSKTILQRLNKLLVIRLLVQNQKKER